MSTESCIFHPERVVEARERLGLNRNQLAKAAGLRASAIQAYEEGTYAPKGRNLIRLAQALQVSETFLTGTDEAHSVQPLKEAARPFGSHGTALTFPNEIERLEAEHWARECGLPLEQFITECVRRYGQACRDQVNQRRAELSGRPQEFVPMRRPAIPEPQGNPAAS